MKISRISLLVLICIAIHMTSEKLSAGTNSVLSNWPKRKGSQAPPPTPRLANHRDAATPHIVDSDSTVWSRRVFSTNQAGRVSVQTNSFTELGNGHNYLGPDGVWRRTKVEFTQRGNYFVTDTGHHSVRLARNLNQNGAVEINVGGVQIRSAPLAIGYYDPSTGNSLTLAVLQNCTGQLLSSNTVIYPNAFREIKCAIEFVDDPSGLHQNLIFEEAPPEPTALGLTAAAHLQIFTEFAPETLQPVKTFAPKKTNPANLGKSKRPASVVNRSNLNGSRSSPWDIEDELTLDFGGRLSFVVGKAFSETAGKLQDADRVLKTFANMGNRRVLIESVPHKSLKSALANLPKAVIDKTSFPKPFAVASVTDPKRLPARRSIENLAPLLAASYERPRNTVVLDYETLTSSTQGTITLKGDSTSYISGTVYIPHLTIEGGAVVKYKWNSGSKIWVYQDPIECRTSQFLPAVFTAEDDHTVGEVIDDTHTHDPFGYPGYTEAALICPGDNNDIHDLHISFVGTALVFMPGSQSTSVRQVQIKHAFYGITIWNSQPEAFASVNPDNVLFHNVQTCFSGSGYYLSARHLTVNGAYTIAGYSYLDNGLYFINCIFANITGDLVAREPNDNKYAGGTIIGYYQCNSQTQPYFGDNQIFSPTDPFITVGLGAQYLKADSVFRNVGDPAIYDVGDSFRTRSTQPPMLMQGLNISGDMTLLPQVPRYIENTPPDLGYWYDAMDYLMIGMYLSDGNLKITPGTVIGTMNGVVPDPLFYGNLAFAQHGLDVLGGNIESVGMPKKAIRFIYAGSSQEQFDSAARAFDSARGKVLDLYTVSVKPDGLATATFQFTEFSTITRPHYHFWALSKDEFDFSNCLFRRGLFKDNQFPDGGTIALNNNLFERSVVWFEERWFQDDQYISAWTTNTLYNNTFKGGLLILQPAAEDTHFADLTLKDNLFDETAISSDWRVYHDYNAYNRTSVQIGFIQPHEIILNNPTLFTQGPFGAYYQTDTALNAGSRLASEASLYHYTTQADQAKKANATVGIGMHYIAASLQTSPVYAWVPNDADGDGIPDYLEDKNGNGVLDDDETSVTQSQTLSGVPDLQNDKNSNLDLDGDGLTTRIELAIGTNPLVSDTPLSLSQMITGEEPNILTFKLPLSFSQFAGLGFVKLQVDGTYPSFQGTREYSDGTTIVRWNANYNPPGQHFVQARLIIAGGAKDASNVSFSMGPLLPIRSNNLMMFEQFNTEFDSNGANLFAYLEEENATYTIELRDPAHPSGGAIKTITGITSSGNIDVNWDLVGDDHNAFTGDSLDAVFHVTLTDSGLSGTQQHRTKRQDTPIIPEGDFTVAYAWDKPVSIGEGAMRDAIQWGVVDPLLTPGGNNPHPYHSIFNDYSYSGFRGKPGHLKTQADVEPLLANLEAMATRNFYFDGHGLGLSLGTVQDTGSDAVNVFLSDIQGRLHNIIDETGPDRRHPYRLVFLNACNTANDTEWSHAFGIIDNITAVP